MKQTFELAFCCAAAFSHSRPRFISLDPSTFENPVPVGSVLYLTATVAYTDPPLVTLAGSGGSTSKQSNEDSAQIADGNTNSKFTRVQIRIDSKVRNVEHGETKPTGQFNYTFLVEKDIKVMPRGYHEFMIWIDARRRAERANETIEALEKDGKRAQGQDDSKKDGVTE